MEQVPLAVIMAGGLLSLGWWASLRRKGQRASLSTSTEFFGSQLGGKSVINYSYTDLPWILFGHDIYYFFAFLWALPYILFPISSSDSGELDELSWTTRNVYCIVVHFILCILQLIFILVSPWMLLLPVWMSLLAIGLFCLLNYGLCSLLNGKELEYWSDPQYAEELPEHAHEQWIFINGVAAG